MPFYYETLLCNEKCTKILYSVLNTNSIKPIAITVLKWISKLNCNFDKTEVFKICLKVTDDTSVQWLQFRILHRFLSVSYYLKKKLTLKLMIVVQFVKRKVRLLNMYFYFAKMFSYYGILSVNTFSKPLI